MNAIILPLVGFLLALFLIIVFFSKENYTSDETATYKKLLILNFIFSILCIVIVLYAFLGLNDLVGFIQKIYLSVMICMCFLIFEYNTRILNLYSKSVSNILMIINGITIFLALITKMNVLNENGIVDGYGPSYNIMFTVVIFYFILITISSFVMLIKNKKEFIKDLPFIILVLLFTVGIVLRKYYPYIIVETFLFSFAYLIMFFTIENPDLRLIKELMESKKNNEKNIEDKSALILRINDTVRNPIKEIRQISDYVLEKELTNEVSNAIKDIKNISQGIYDSINKVLDITSIDSKNLKLTDTKYNIRTIIKEIILQNKKNVKEGVELRCEISEALPNKLEGDGVKIKQIINTVIKNSLENTEKGFIEVKVESIKKYDVCRLIISVEDSGKGMSIKKINDILSKKEELTKEELEKIDKLDLNLNMVNKIVHLIGGTITIKSEKEKGTIITIIIDQKVAKDEDQELEKIYEYGEKAFNKKKIALVTEDNQYKKNIKKMLAGLEVEIKDTEYAKEVLDEVRNGENYEIIICEENLSKIDAHNLLEKLKKEEYTNPVVLISESENTAQINKCYEEGFYKVIRKNKEKNEIIDVVKSVISK